MAQIKSNITFVIFTYNEEKTIEYPIRCFLPYGEVIISDDSSTDRTVKISEKLGARVIKRKTHLAFVENKEESDFIFSHVKTDWVFWGFSDTMAPKTCLELYKKISHENKYKVVAQKLRTFFYNSHEYFNHFNITTRFFKKDAIDFSNNTIHQMGKFASHVKPSEILYLLPIDEYSLYHFSTHTTASIIANMNKYSYDHAQSTSKPSFLKMTLWSTSFFVMAYFLNGGLRYGIEGFIVAVQYSLYPFIVYSKTYEKKYNFTSQSIEDNYSKSKKELLTKSPKSNIFQKLVAYLENLIISFIHKSYKFNKKKS